jgi:uncharacterized protein YPO0396
MAKHLKRVLLIHWHFYTHQLIELDQINFLTGKTGVGKTTIIDALQVVLLGDTNARRFFNKAANEKSERTLEGYLSGEYGDDGDRASRSLRQGRFSSIVACEFQDSETQRMFTVGSVFDSFDVGKWANQWFIFGDRIPDHHFIGQDQTPMDIGRFRAWIRHLPERTRYQLPASNQQYQNQLAAYLGGLKRNYFTLFRRAVAFTPIQDITSFITDYICEADRSIDIHELKENLRHYRRLELQAAQIKAQVDHLREGIDLYREYQNEAANHRLFSFLVRRGEQADIQEQVKAKELELADRKPVWPDWSSSSPGSMRKCMACSPTWLTWSRNAMAAICTRNCRTCRKTSPGRRTRSTRSNDSPPRPSPTSARKPGSSPALPNRPLIWRTDGRYG